MSYIKIQYQKYLQSPEWKELRDKACKRANYKCEFCGKDYEAVHHVKYPKNLSEDSLDNLIVVCKACHDKSHGIREMSTNEMNEQYFIEKFNEIANESLDYFNENAFEYTECCNEKDCDCLLIINTKMDSMSGDKEHQYGYVVCSEQKQTIFVKFNNEKISSISSNLETKIREIILCCMAKFIETFKELDIEVSKNIKNSLSGQYVNFKFLQREFKKSEIIALSSLVLSVVSYVIIKNDWK